jgi:hypothetical protein
MEQRARGAAAGAAKAGLASPEVPWAMEKPAVLEGSAAAAAARIVAAVAAVVGVVTAAAAAATND